MKRSLQEANLYSWLFRHLPGPLWMRIIEAVLLLVIVVLVLFQWGFPWVQEVFFNEGSTV